MKIFRLLVVLLLTFSMVGCPAIEKSARDSVAAAKGYLDAAKQHHPECFATGAHGANCDIISRGVAAKDTVIDAVQIYCSGAAYDSGAACAPNKDAEPKLRAALQNLNQIMSDVKKIGGAQ